MWTYNSSELYHYGVLGMKWGVRKAKQSINARIDKRQKKTKYLNKATRNRNRLLQDAAHVRKTHNMDDEELWDIMTPSERKEQIENGNYVADWLTRKSDVWNVAIKDISNSNNVNYRQMYKRYKKKAFNTE